MKHLYLNADRKHPEGERLKMYLRNGKVMSRIPKMPGKGGVRRSCKVLKGDAGPMAPALHRLLSEAMFHLMAELYALL